MNVEAAAAAVAYLTSMTSGWNDDATEQLVYEFERLDDEAALVEAVGKVARSWTYSGRVPLGVIMDAYHHEIANRERVEREQVEARLVRCDGSGWNDDGTMPCSTCNPALWRIWNEPGLLPRWRAGIATWKLLGFEKASECEKELGRERCPAPLDVEWDTFDSREGMRVALDAYRDEYGREPSKAQVAWLAAAGRPSRSRTSSF
jgi:hypothetical protein